jgi:SAM-dependent methyltransferase
VLRLAEVVASAASPDDIDSAELVSESGRRYPVVDSIPRFVSADNYARSFGLQWNCFRATQLDSRSGQPISRDRFFKYSGWTADELAGKWVLDVGCGAGRFAEVALDAGANVVAVDYSSAVDACRANHRDHPRLHLVQADLYHLPFAPARFDYVYCFGVLQHTPDVRAAFMALPEQLAPGGKLAVDVYPKLLRNVFWSKYWLRPFTKRVPPERLFGAVQTLVRTLLPISTVVGRVPRLGRRLRYLLPVANYEGVYPLSRAQLYEWAVLDTFDMLSPAHDRPQTEATVRTWFRDAGLRDVWVGRTGFVVGRGSRPTEADVAT